MLISELCTRRPVFASVLNLIIILLGVLCYSKLEIRESPNIENPIVVVQSTFAGADASYMEKNVTNIIEQQIPTVKNIDHFTSTSANQTSQIVIFFKLDADLNKAVNDVNSAVAKVSNLLPENMQAPQVSQVNGDNFPVIWLSGASDKYNNMQLTNIMKKQIVPVLQRIASVGSVMIYGGNDYAILVEPIPEKLYQFKLLAVDLHRAIQVQSQDYPSGILETNSKNFVIKLSGALDNVEGFENIVVLNSPSGLVKLKDVANVSLKPLDAQSFTRYNGNNSIAIGIVKKAGASAINLIDDVEKSLASLSKLIPEGIKLQIAHNTVESLQGSVNAVYRSIFEALVLVALVVYLFLGSFRMSLIPFVAIPISLIGSLIFIKICGFSINIFSLLAMVLAIGLVVDDAIVMLENIYRHYEGGQTPFDASISAIKEITFAIVVMTITLAAVFLPIGFIDGYLGKLFIEFAWTLAFCVLVSGFVALTLTPMLARYLITDNLKPSGISQKFNSYIHYIENKYLVSLEYLLVHKKQFILICIATVSLLIWSFMTIHKAFSPVEDNGFFFVKLNGPDGSTLDSTRGAVEKVESIIKSTPEINGYFSIGGFGNLPNNGFIFVRLQDWALRSKSQAVIIEEINSKLKLIPDMNISALNPTNAFSNGMYDVEFDLVGDNFDSIDKASVAVIKKLKGETNVFQGPDKTVSNSIPSISVVIDRDKAYSYNVPLDSIGTNLQYLISDQIVATFRMAGETYNCYIIYGRENRDKISDLDKIFIKSSDNSNIFSLANFADIKETITAQSYNHYNARSVVSIYSGLKNKVPLSNAINIVNNIAKDDLPDDVSLEFRGQIERLENNNSQVLLTFLLALLFIYLVLSAQFESFTDPLIILFSVPFSIVGALLLLIITGNNLNIYSNIGLITLIGLVTKNAIMIVEFANQLREKALSVHDALIESCRLRFRPIIMTSMATIFGAIPFILATGAGAEARNAIGITVFGGMLIGTIFTLFIIPNIYFLSKR